MQSQSVHLISINLQGSISNLNFHQPSFVSPLAHVSFKNQPKWPLGRPLQKRQMDLRAQSFKKKRKRKKDELISWGCACAYMIFWSQGWQMLVCVMSTITTILNQFSFQYFPISCHAKVHSLFNITSKHKAKHILCVKTLSFVWQLCYRMHTF